MVISSLKGLIAFLSMFLLKDTNFDHNPSGALFTSGASSFSFGVAISDGVFQSFPFSEVFSFGAGVSPAEFPLLGIFSPGAGIFPAEFSFSVILSSGAGISPARFPLSGVLSFGAGIFPAEFSFSGIFSLGAGVSPAEFLSSIGFRISGLGFGGFGITFFSSASG